MEEGVRVGVEVEVDDREALEAHLSCIEDIED